MWPIELIKGVVNIATSYFKRKTEKTTARHQRDLAIIENQARLAASEKEFNHKWEMANLQDKDDFLRNVSFFLFTSPIIIVVIWPDYGFHMFQRLDTIPEWLLQIWFYMIAGVWGVAALKNNVSEIIANMRSKK